MKASLLPGWLGGTFGSFHCPLGALWAPLGEPPPHSYEGELAPWLARSSQSRKHAFHDVFLRARDVSWPFTTCFRPLYSVVIHFTTYFRTLYSEWTPGTTPFGALSVWNSGICSSGSHFADSGFYNINTKYNGHRSSLSRTFY